MNPRATLTVLAALTLIGCTLPIGAAETAARPPNVVIIFADDMGYADIGPFGGKKITPNLDRLATQGRRFTNFHVAQPVCSASRTALLTGCYSNRLGIHGALPPTATHGLAAAETTLAEMLKARGYATGMAGKWHLGHHPQFLPVHHGFDEYLGLPYSNDMWPHNPDAKQPNPNPPLPLIEGDRVQRMIGSGAEQEPLTALFTQRAVRFIENNRDKPFFFYLAHPMPHVPLYTSARFRGKTGQGTYADVVAEIDWSVGEIMAALQRTGLAERTILIFTSDNGPWLVYGNHAGSAGPLREGKQTVWEGGVRVPFIIRGPGIPANTSSDAMLMSIDLLPTLARVTGAALPTRPIDGLDVWPVLSGAPGATNPHDGYAYYFATNELQAVASGDGRWKLILPHTYNALQQKVDDGRRGTVARTPVETAQLFDLRADLGERNNVAAQHPEVVRQLEAFAEKTRGELGDTLTKREGKGVRPADRVATVEGK
jgi:arylsulfatase A